jgi:hypothetical protein
LILTALFLALLKNGIFDGIFPNHLRWLCFYPVAPRRHDVTSVARDILLGGSSAASSSGDPDALQATWRGCGDYHLVNIQKAMENGHL